MTTDTTTDSTTASARDRARGRGWFWAGILVGLLGIPAYIVQFSLGMLTVPWYVPALATLGALMLLLAVVQRRTIPRLVGLVLVAALAGLQWYTLGSLAKLPSYEGPVEVGRKMPAFTTATADGRPFTEKDLQAGEYNVLVFNRGRW